MAIIKKNIIDNYDKIIELLGQKSYSHIYTILINGTSLTQDGTLSYIYRKLSNYSIKKHDTYLLSKLLEADVNFAYNSINITKIIENNYLKPFFDILKNLQHNPYKFGAFYFHILDNVDILKLLFEYGYVMDDDYILYVLHKNYTSIIQYLISNNYDVQNTVDIFEKLISINLETLKLLTYNNIQFDKNLKTMYSSIINYNKMDCILYLMEINPYDNVNDLMLLSRDNLNMWKYFLGIGADVNYVDNKNIMGLRMDTIKFLFACGYHMTDDNMNELLKRKIYDVSVNDIIYLLEYGADIHHVLNDKELLKKVLHWGEFEHMKYLLENHYELLGPTINDMFISKCIMGQLKSVQYLYDLGVDMNGIVLVFGCFFGNYDIVKFLFEHGFKTDENLFVAIKNGCCGNGETYNMIRQYTSPYVATNRFYVNKYEDIIHLLIDYKIPVYDFDKLHIELYIFSNLKTIKYFVANGLDINEYLKMHWYIDNKKYDIIRWLLGQGMNLNLKCDYDKKIREDENLKTIFKDYGYEF